MPQPNSRDLYVSRPLTNILVAYQQNPNQFIADAVFPVVPVQRQGDLFYKYNKGDWFRTEAEKRAPATESAGAGWEVSQDTYFAHVYAVHKDVDDQTRANADSVFNLDRDATLWVSQNLLLKRDLVFAASFLVTGVWGTDLTGVAAAPGAGQFLRFDVAGSDPIGVVAAQRLAIQKATGFAPNVLVIGPSVLVALESHAAILERIKYTERGIVTTDLLASLFGVQRVVVSNAIQNTAAKGVADSMAFIADKSMLLVYANPTPGLMQPSGGYIFAWTGLLGGGAAAGRVRRFRMEPIESDRIEGESAYDMKVVSPDVGVFFATAVS